MKKKKITILATSDVHGSYLPWDYSLDMKTSRGGLSRVFTVVEDIRKENPNTILVDGGDLIQGNSMEVFLNEAKFPGIQVANYMGYDILNMGNHEFNFGMDTLERIMSQFQGVNMMGNLYKNNNGRAMPGLHIKELDGIRLAFISLNTPLVRHFEKKRGNLDGYDVIDADIELEKLLEEVENSGQIDGLIGIFHMGATNENNIPNTGVIDLLDGVSGTDKIDLVIGGHMHQIIDDEYINDTLYTQSGKNAEAVIRIDLFFDCHEGENILVDIKSQAISIDDSITSSPVIEELMEPYHKKLRKYANDPIGYIRGGDLTEPDDIPGLPQTMVAQTKLSDFFLEVMLYYSGADVVATQIDNPYPIMREGEVKRKHIYNSYQYAGGDINNYLVTGRDLKDYMEWSAGYFNQSYQGDISVSFDSKRSSFKYSTFDIFGNVKYLIDLTKPMGNRIINLRRMDDSPILPDEKLILGMNKYRMDFLVSDEGPLHGREFPLLWSSVKDDSLGVRGTIRNLTMKYFQELEDNTYRPKKQKRWAIRTGCVDYSMKNLAVKLLRDGAITLPLNQEGAVDNTKSLNIYEKMDIEEYNNLIRRYPGLEEITKANSRMIDVIRKINLID